MNSGKLGLEEFKKTFKEYKLSIDDSALDAIFASFDPEKTGQITYSNVLKATRVQNYCEF